MQSKRAHKVAYYTKLVSIPVLYYARSGQYTIKNIIYLIRGGLRKCFAKILICANNFTMVLFKTIRGLRICIGFSHTLM
jgi:hypothetical protein